MIVLVPDKEPSVLVGWRLNAFRVLFGLYRENKYSAPAGFRNQVLLFEAIHKVFKNFKRVTTKIIVMRERDH